MESLTTWRIVNWVSEPFSGSYTYSILMLPEKAEKPVENTFFAGSFMTTGNGNGGGRLASGKNGAKMVNG